MTEISHAREISRDVFSATLGSVFCCYTGQPMDTIKVRMQTKPTLYTGIGKTLSLTVSNEGLVALWKGAIPTACGMAAENAVAFGFNEALKRAFPAPELPLTVGTNQTPDLLRPFVMGAVTAIPVSLVLLPSEVIKAKTQVAIGTVSSREIMNSMMKQNGMRSFFVGMEAQMARDCSFYAVFFGGYELFCYGFQKFTPSIPDELRYFLSGGFAGMLGWAVAMPFDVPKTNVQSRYDTKVLGSYLPEMAKIARERGFGAFYSGLGPTLVRAFPANAALFLGVEMGKRFFDNLLW
eukprot:CAMPEP_0194373686 /NCGR_PEP_ID=MMETSP0174-20130528/22165_1 /TAXON_ID=216777 /ORGANISM="Proboscia alata, Strain PI-D3" /LENGTH=292 /DNA_ID=CAMNT_0039152927 /DNA_START=320 /DNA_END=1195 /DNA_ORIENTATION=+